MNIYNRRASSAIEGDFTHHSLEPSLSKRSEIQCWQGWNNFKEHAVEERVGELKSWIDLHVQADLLRVPV